MDLYLKNSIIAEPIINNWYAHLLLIPPSTFAMTLANRHTRRLKSFLEDPTAYSRLFDNTDSFTDLTKSSTDISNLYNKMTRELNRILDLNDAIIKLYQILEGLNGEALEPQYQNIPDELKGYVELFYDIENNAKFRFIEPLLYISEFYKPELQSVFLSICKQDNRPFSLNIPRFISNNIIEINKSFSSVFYDKLFSLRTKPATKKYITELFSSVDIDFNSVKHLFTEAAPQKNIPSNLSKNKFSIKYFGHACILIETDNCSILIDPIIAYRTESNIDRFSYDDLPEQIDYLLITHSHMDHVVIEHLIQLRHKIKSVVVPSNNSAAVEDPSLKLIFKALGFNQIQSLDIFDNISLPNIEIKAIPFLGEHGDLNIFSKTTYFMNIYGCTFLFAVDSNNLQKEVYENIFKITGEIDNLFISLECDGAPVSWLYGQFMPKKINHQYDKTRKLITSDADKITQLINIFSIKNVYLYARGKEPWLSYIMEVNQDINSKTNAELAKLQDYCKSRNILLEDLYGKNEIFYN